MPAAKDAKPECLLFIKNSEKQTYQKYDEVR